MEETDMKKKIFSVVLIVSMIAVLALTACGGGGNNDGDTTEAKGQVIMGTSTEANGDWAYSAFTSSPNATDQDVMLLTDDCTTVQTNETGDYVINDSVVDNYERSEDESTGDVTYTITIKKGLKFNNGDEIKAENFLAWILFTYSPAGGEMGAVTAGYNMVPGGDKYRAGETNVLAGARLLDDYQFSVTILKTGYDGNTYQPYYYDLGYASLQAVNLPYWFGEGWHVKDDGEGAYMVNDNGTEFTAANIQDKVAASQFATSDRVTAGPYNLVSFDKSANEITLEVNPNYCGDFQGQKPQVQKIIIVRAEDATVLNDLQTGRIELYSGIADGGQVKEALDLIDSGTINSDHCEYDRAGFGYFQFACDLGPAQFVEFRQAVAHLLDRVEFANTFCQGYGSVVHGPYCTAFSMYKKSEKFLSENLDTYDYDPAKAVELLKAAGFTLNADGTDYVDGSGLVRYKEVTAEQAQNYDQFNVTLADGRILMPATLNWASSEGNSVSDLLSTMLANGSATKEAGVEIKQTTMTFPELLNYMYRQDAYGIGGDYSVPTYNMFNLATGWNSGVYDFAFEFTTNETYIAQGYNSTHLYDEELDKLSMDMVYGVEPGDEDTYLDLWQKFVVRYNELLPRVPLYANIYVTVYPKTLENYSEDSFWGFSRAILYATYVGE
jgi:peptide/nickel transport system substrate-binding protein